MIPLAIAKRVSPAMSWMFSFSIKFLTMLFDGLDADTEFGGDLLVHVPLGNELKQLGFT